MAYVEERCLEIGVHKLMGTRQDWHEETVRQFFSTIHINQSRTSTTWMSGKNMKITVMPLQNRNFCNIQIEDSLTDEQQKDLDS